jgi:nicotinamidase-related amidase
MLLVDIQERLLPSISGQDSVRKNARILCTVARELKIPVKITEQYPKGIGPTIPDLRDVTAGCPVFEKKHFSCCDAPGFDAFFFDSTRPVTILFGIESHICILSTLLDMRERDLPVVLAADACGSRDPLHASLALEQARSAGALVLPVESVVYRLLGCAGTSEFKTLLPLFK